MQVLFGFSQAIKDAIEVPEGVGDEVVNDFEEECAKRIEIEHREEYLAKVANRISNLEINIRNTPREGKKVAWQRLLIFRCFRSNQ